MDKADAYQTGINELLEARGFTDEDKAKFMAGGLTEQDLLGRGFTQEDVDKLREYSEALLDANQSMLEAENQMHEVYRDQIDEINEEVDKQIDHIEKLSSVAEHYKNIADIVGKDRVGVSDALMEDLDDTVVQAANAKLDADTKRLETLQASREELLAKMGDTAQYGENAQKQFKKDLDKLNEEIDAAHEEWASSFEDAVNATVEAYNNALDRAMEKAKTAIGITDSLEGLKDFIKSVDEITVKDTDKIYNLTKISRDIDKTLAGTDSLKGRKELLAMQERINQAMKDGTKYTQADLDILQKELELRKARIAFEESSQANQIVRMQRDNEGNWSYIYTADQDKIADAEQQLDDKIYEYNKLVEESIQNLADLGESLTSQYLEQADKINKDMTLSQEEKERQLQILEDKYYQAMNEIGAQSNRFVDASKVLFEDDYIQRAAHLGAVKDINGEYIEDINNVATEVESAEEKVQRVFEETPLAQATGLSTMKEQIETYIEAVAGENGYISQAKTTSDKLNKSLETTFTSAGTSVEEYAGKVKGANKDLQDDIAKTKGLVEEYLKWAKEAMSTAASDLVTYEKNYSGAIDALIKKNEEYVGSCNDLIKKINEVNQTPINPPTYEIPTSVAPTGGTSTGSKESSGGEQNPDTGPYSVDTDTTSKSTPGNPGIFDNTEYERLMSQQEPVKTAQDEIKELRKEWNLYNATASPKINRLDWYYINKIEGTVYATSKYPRLNRYLVPQYYSGGYTGTWDGPNVEANGRLAMLHQKELVLNDTDTANMLAAVAMIRQIASVIDLQASAYSHGIGQPTITSQAGIAAGELEQNVHIEATFPNVQNHLEIEEAFNNLIGKASQFANRSR